MCRLFGQISLHSSGADDFLATKDLSLLRQSFLNSKHRQKDGWGLAAWSALGASWELEKSKKPAYEDRPRFLSASKRWRSRSFIAHVRHASNPRNLPPSKLLAVENAQPFAFGRLCFAHNGTLNIPDEVAGTLGGFRSRLHGTNDSEVLFWLFVKCWHETPNDLPARRWPAVFKNMATQIDRVWKGLPKNQRRHKTPYRGLNFVAGNGETLAAMSYYDKAEGVSLCGQDRPYFEMCLNRTNGRVAVASEPMDRAGDWKRILNRHVAVVEPSGSWTLTAI